MTPNAHRSILMKALVILLCMTTPLENIPANTDTSTTLGNIQTKLLDEKIQELEQPSERQSLPKDIVTVVMDGLSNQRSYELLENKF